MPTTNNVRITTPGGTITYVDDGSTSSNSTSSTSTSTSDSTSDSTNATISGTNNEIILKNIGTGQLISAGLINSDTYGIKSLVAGNNISLTSDDSTITINSNTKINLKAGDNISIETDSSGNSVISANDSFNTSDIKAGDNITIVENSDSTITISSTNSSSSTELSELTDVDLSTTVPVNGDLLQYNGTKWVPYKNIQYPVGSIMCIKLSGTMAMASNGSELVLKTLTSMPTGWTATYSDAQVTVTTTIPNGTAFPISMVASVTSTQGDDTNAKSAVITAFNQIGASFDFDPTTGVFKIYRVNQDTVFSSGDETNIDLYINFYIQKDQSTLWS